ncbi:centrosomal protein of 78 kDa isoform X2 [Salarias fasciatus]|nr:centrosomal protein of 78 kDa isoform X2 [Salarias fasciatus]XP_029961614.1 centrosomal protein of 78 kDa isoform X2 [Salarias fasciatus]
MVQDSAQIRRQGAQDFMAYYEYACARQESVPLPAIKVNLDKGMLDFNGDRLKLADWPPVLNSISINKHLTHIAISSTYQANLGSGDTDRRYFKTTFKKKIPVIRCKDMTFKLCKALRECLTISPKLKTLHLHGLPLRERDLITLTKGLAKTTSLENLSLANCPVSDEGLEVICQSVKYSTNIRVVDFTGCSLTWRGAEHMANIIKHQALQRHGTAWAESLRYRRPQFEGMGGLRRVTLNANSLIGDRGASALACELAEDLWVKAVDLQRCGLSNEGARRLLEALKTNSSLCVLDIRNNPLVDKVLIKTILEKVLMNPDGQSSEYCWIKPPSAEPQKASGPKRRAPSSTARGAATFRIAPHKRPPPPGRRDAGAAHRQKPGSSCSYVPWRAAARAGRQRGLPPGVSVRDQSFQAAASVKVTVESESEEEEEDEEAEVVVEVEQRPPSFDVQDRLTGQQCELLQMELKECRLRLAEERRARLKAESRLMEFELENARLRDANTSLSEALAATGSTSAPAALEDEAVLQSIENSFTKFHAFLDLLRDAGFGQLASMAGIDHFDFRPLGRPQLSSTLGAHSDGASLVKEECGDVHAKTHDVPLKVSDLPAPSIGASTNEDRLKNLTYTQASGSVAEPGVGGGEEPDHYIKPYTRHDSGSEHSVHSQMSFGKTSKTRRSHSRSNSDSHRSNGSYENIHSYRRPSRGSSSVSGSDIISDKAESVGSAGSWSRGKERSATVGEPSQSKNTQGQVDLEHFSALTVQSDDDSF